ncbi:hypothetical protein V5O48_014047 [Marasmius crinis-equi]|uniref:Uncharacterized protein n=1 Tax=Marasmius crinis-equi TaxID=585013 RepID=A0ABR3EYG0_9AGAR
MDWPFSGWEELLATAKRTWVVGVVAPESAWSNHTLATWKKHDYVDVLIMNPPPLETITEIVKNLYHPQLRAEELHHFLKLLVETFNVDFRRFWDIFNHLRFHHDRRFVYRNAVRNYMDDLRRVFSRQGDVEKLISLLHGGGSEEDQIVFSQIAVIMFREKREPLMLEHLYEQGLLDHSRRDFPCCNIRSRLVLQVLCETWQKHRAKDLQTIISQMKSNSNYMGNSIAIWDSSIMDDLYVSEGGGKSTADVLRELEKRLEESGGNRDGSGDQEVN